MCKRAKFTHKILQYSAELLLKRGHRLLIIIDAREGVRAAISWREPINPVICRSPRGDVAPGADSDALRRRGIGVVAGGGTRGFAAMTEAGRRRGDPLPVCG